MGKGRIDPSQTTWTTPIRKVQCPTCERMTTRSNYRMDAISARTIVICESCGNPLPPPPSTRRK